MKQSLITGKKEQPFESLLNSLYTNISINILHTVLFSMITSAVPDFSQSVIGPENLYHHLNQSY